MHKEKPLSLFFSLSLSLTQLKQAVEALTQSVSSDACGRAIENFAVSINACANRNGAHTEKVITKFWVGHRHLDAYSKIARFLVLLKSLY